MIEHRPTSLSELLSSTQEQLQCCDIARMNLLCAQGLPGAEDMDIESCLSQINQWTEHVRQETLRLYPLYLLNPNPNKGSLGVFRFFVLIRTLKDTYDLKHYLLPKKGTGFQGTAIAPLVGPDPGFANSKPLFIHGLLSSQRIGSCSSLPVLFAAVARRLRYPVKLALSVMHVFNRWESLEEMFNMDGSGPDYIRTPPSEDFIDEPRPWTQEEKNTTCYLRSITPPEELAVGMMMRSACLKANMDIVEAHRACAIACSLSPEHPAYANSLAFIERHLQWSGRMHWPLAMGKSFGKMPDRVVIPKRTSLVAEQRNRVAIEPAATLKEKQE